MPIREKWTADYNIPVETPDILSPTITSEVSELARIRAEVRSLLTQLERSDEGKFMARAKRLIEDVKNDLRETEYVPISESTLQHGRHQPRWRKRRNLSPSDPGNRPPSSTFYVRPITP